MSEQLVKSKERLKQHGECYTPRALVLKMLRQLPVDVWEDKTKTFLDPTAGNGNFVVEVLKLKLKMGSSVIQALSTCYGCELLEDNVQECKERLLSVCEKFTGLTRESEWIRLVDKNVVCHDALTYDFSFGEV